MKSSAISETTDNVGTRSHISSLDLSPPYPRGRRIDRRWGVLTGCPPRIDPRRVTEGCVIPAKYYADQPYVVKTHDGAWLCVLTTGLTHEGARGQHIVALRSRDRGETWSDPVCIESAEGPEASWAVPLLCPSGRIFVFYVYNADDIRELPADDPPNPGGKTLRMDSHGHYVFRWSDDGGRTWSADRAEIPVREFEIDRRNSTGGNIRLFWNVGRPLISQGTVYLTLHKVAGFGAGWFTRSEGALVCSSNLLVVPNPGDATWQTLPEGDHGLRTPSGYGPISEEQSMLELGDGSFFCVYRTVDGYPVGSYSRDRGVSWQEPRFLEYANGRRLKHPRAACFAWKLSSGCYALWFHNHGGEDLRLHPQRKELGYDDRNPVWMCRGHEVQTPRGMELAWETPEIALYDDDPCIRISYPDLVEEGGAIYLTETQKATARVHKMEARLSGALLQGTSAFSAEQIRQEASLVFTSCTQGSLCTPELPPLIGKSLEGPYGASDQRSGFSLEIVFSINSSSAILMGAWDVSFGGIRLETTKSGSIVLALSDGRSECVWSPAEPLLRNDGKNHLVIVVDGGPKIISAIVNGVFCDGGEVKQFGWGRYSPHLRTFPAKLPIYFDQNVLEARLYPRPLLHTEAMTLFHQI